jgi:membrane protein DedA with SNARE-associated domain
MSASNSPEPPGRPGAAPNNAPTALPEPAGPSRQSAAQWRPWHGRPRARDLICFLAIMVSWLYGLAMIPLTPTLIATHPLLLEMLSGSNPAIVAAGSFSGIKSKLALAVVIAGAMPGMKFDWVVWWAGRLWGRRMVDTLGRHSRRTGAIAARAERRGTRFARPAVLLSALVPVCTAPVYAAAGWVGLPLVPFMVLDAIGCATRASLLATSGYLLGSRGVAVANLVARYALVSVGVLAAATLGPYMWHTWQGRRKGRRSLAADQREGGEGKDAPKMVDNRDGTVPGLRLIRWVCVWSCSCIQSLQ